MKGLNPEQRSFLFKLVHNLLPTNNRLFKMNMAPSPQCDACGQGVVQDLPHVMLDCDTNGIINDWIVGVLFDIDPNLIHTELNSVNILCMNLDMEPEVFLPVVWFLTTAFSLLWRAKQSRKPMELNNLKALIEGENEILKKTCYLQAAEKIESAINFFTL